MKRKYGAKPSANTSFILQCLQLVFKVNQDYLEVTLFSRPLVYLLNFPSPPIHQTAASRIKN